MNYRKKWDVFICHASEDKREIADPLANKLTSMGLKVWYDKFSMRWGSRLMKEIDNGLVNLAMPFLIKVGLNVNWKHCFH